MNGAFHGVITAAGPGGHPLDAVPGAVRAPVALLVGDGEVGVGAVVARAAGDHAGAQRAQQHRHVGALDRREALDVRVDQVGEPVQVRRAARRARARPRRGRRRARRAPPGRPRAAPARATSASGLQSIGERSSKRASERDPLARRCSGRARRRCPRDRPSSELLDGLEVVDRVAEREAVAAVDLHRREHVVLLVRRGVQRQRRRRRP